MTRSEKIEVLRGVSNLFDSYERSALLKDIIPLLTKQQLDKVLDSAKLINNDMFCIACEENEVTIDE